MEVRETGLQAKPGFAGHTWPAGHTGFCWPYRVLLAKQGFAGQTGLQAKPGLAGQTGLQAKRYCRPNRVLLAIPGLQAKRDCRPNRVLLAIPGLLVLKPNSRPRTQD